MYRFLRVSMAVVMTLCVAAAVWAEEAADAAPEGIMPVPTAIAQVEDEDLRDALIQDSPHYDYLIRPDQIRTFISVYQSVNDGEAPALSPEDVAQLAEATQPQQQVYVAPAAPQVYYYPPGPVYYQPSRPSVTFGFSIGGGGRRGHRGPYRRHGGPWGRW